jgi:FlaA1/EpsC-like NDP-sugar epimerase
MTKRRKGRAGWPDQAMRTLTSVIHNLLRLPGLLGIAVQTGAFFLATLLAFLLRFDLSIPREYTRHLVFAGVAYAASKLVVFLLLGLNRFWWRYVSTHDVLRLLAGNILGSLLGGAVVWFGGPSGFPRSILILDFILCFGLTATARILVKTASDILDARQSRHGKTKAVIYGAGDGGVMLAREIRQNPALSYHVVGFVDDDENKKGAMIDGVRVFGKGSELAHLVELHNVDTVFIAIPSASGQQMTQILNACSEAKVTYKTMPAMGDFIEGNGLLSQIRDVSVEDLLGRKPVRLDTEPIRKKIEGQVILVTGAAGSIGSELCRQIARFSPAALIGYDAAETPLFFLDQEMQAGFPDVNFQARIGNIQNRQRLEAVFADCCPAMVFHAAAYKHVPMMECNAFEAVENNVFGTRTLAQVSAESGVRDFVMISSDKAVRPANVMGATKRLAEMVVGSMQGDGTKFVSVRFGNVLGSNGSVIPIFKSQIAAGGPVTVTDPRMKRYFMTIPEASQLVLQASTLGTGGEIFVLDMGEPVKITDLARNLILLSGLRPGEDIKIKYTSPRPGEKLLEELHMANEKTLPTVHRKISVFAGNSHKHEEIGLLIRQLEEICQARDLRRLIPTVKRFVPDYNPSTELLSQAVQVPREGHGNGVAAAPRFGTASDAAV